MMKRGKSEAKLDKYDVFLSLGRHRSIQILMGIALLYVLLVTLEIPLLFNSPLTGGLLSLDPLSRPSHLESNKDLQQKDAPTRPLDWVSRKSLQVGSPRNSFKHSKIMSSLQFDPTTFHPSGKDGSLELHKSAKTAWEEGRKLWEEIESGKVRVLDAKTAENRSYSCPHSVVLSGSEFLKQGKVVELPCGLTLGSHVTIVAKPRGAHAESEPRISLANDGGEPVMVSQFMMELQGLKTVEGEDPPRILHFNPRLKGDWSGKPVIEQNTCYRMQWGTALRCEGWKSKADEETGELVIF